jgi:hypothetical protein
MVLLLASWRNNYAACNYSLRIHLRHWDHLKLQDNLVIKNPSISHFRLNDVGECDCLKAAMVLPSAIPRILLSKISFGGCVRQLKIV